MFLVGNFSINMSLLTELRRQQRPPAPGATRPPRWSRDCIATTSGLVIYNPLFGLIVRRTMALALDILSYSHDARLIGVQIDFATEIRSLTSTFTYHDDCGLASVAGKTVSLTAEDIALLQSRVYGAMTNPETIDTCVLSVSDETAAHLSKWLEMGCRNPKARLSLTTHSGSIWEIMCESLSLRFAS